MPSRLLSNTDGSQARLVVRDAQHYLDARPDCKRTRRAAVPSLQRRIQRGRYAIVRRAIWNAEKEAMASPPALMQHG